MSIFPAFSSRGRSNSICENLHNDMFDAIPIDDHRLPDNELAQDSKIVHNIRLKPSHFHYEMPLSLRRAVDRPEQFGHIAMTANVAAKHSPACERNG